MAPMIAVIGEAPPQAFPVFETMATTQTSDTDPLTLNLPSGIQAGDMLIACISTQRAPDNTFVWPVGWNVLFFGIQAGNATAHIAWCWATGSEGSTINLDRYGSGPGARCAAVVQRFSGAHPYCTPEIAATYLAGATQTQYDPPSLTPSWGSAKTMWIAAAFKDGGAVPSAAPSGYSNLGATNDDSGNCAMGMANRQSEAASEDPGTFTITSGAQNVHVITIAIAPAGASVGCCVSQRTMTAPLTNNTVHAVNLPTGIVSGDLLLMHSGIINGVTYTVPSGWTQLYQIAGASNQFICFYRFANGSEGATVNVTISASNMPTFLVEKIKNAANGVAPEAGTAVVGSASSTPNPPPVTASWGSMRNLFITTIAINGTASPRPFPAGYIHGQAGMINSPSTRGLFVSGKQTVAATDDPGAYTLTGSPNSNLQTIVIKPAA